MKAQALEAWQEAAANRVIASVCKRRNIPLDALLSRSSPPRISKARQLAAFEMSKAGLTLMQIGLVLDRDHSTAAYMIAVYKREHPVKANA